MRILHLLASPVFTGPAEAVLQLALAQRELGHEVEVAVDTRRSQHTSEELAVPRFEAHALRSEIPLELSVKSNPAGFVRDVLSLRRAPAGVVHCHFSHDHLLARLAGRSVLIRSIHAPRSLRWSTPHAAGWTVPTEALARKLLGRDVLVLPALIDAAFSPPLSKTPGARIGMVSTFQASRRHQLGLEAFALVRARVPAATLELIGDGVLEPTLRELARPLGEAVRFTGYRSGQSFVDALKALDEVWVLGLGNDFSGRAAAQARACGVRVVAVDEGALEKWADAIVAPVAEAIAAAALSHERRALRLEPPRESAERVLALYARAQKREAA